MIFYEDWIRNPLTGGREPKRVPVDQIPNLVSVANDTKWRELRTAMLDLEEERPFFRCKNIETGGVSQWDGEWLYHWLRGGGWRWMEWVELRLSNPQHRDAVRAILRKIRFAGEETAEGFRLYGYIRTGQAANYIE